MAVSQAKFNHSLWDTITWMLNIFLTEFLEFIELWILSIRGKSQSLPCCKTNISTHSSNLTYTIFPQEETHCKKAGQSPGLLSHNIFLMGVGRREKSCFLRINAQIYFLLKVVLLRTCFWWSKPAHYRFYAAGTRTNCTALNLWKDHAIWNQSMF